MTLKRIFDQIGSGVQNTSKKQKLEPVSANTTEKLPKFGYSVKREQKSKIKLQARWDAKTILRKNKKGKNKEKKDTKLRKIIFLIKSPFFKAFESVAKKEFWSESFIFVNKYRNLRSALKNKDTKNEKIKELWLAINAKHIGPNSQQPINIQDTLVTQFNEINTKLQKGGIDEKLKGEMLVVLKQAAAEVSTLIYQTLNTCNKFSFILADAKADFAEKDARKAQAKAEAKLQQVSKSEKTEGKNEEEESRGSLPTPRRGS